MPVYYISQGRLCAAQNGEERPLTCGAIETYKRNLMEIQKKTEWKTSGAGAAFMGVQTAQVRPEEVDATVQSFCLLEDGRLAYAAALENNTGLYLKSPEDPSTQTEGYILRKNGMRIFETDYAASKRRIVASVSDGARERHLALFDSDSPHYSIITEGDSVDCMPRHSLRNPDVIYYASAGFYVNSQSGAFYLGRYGVCRLDLETGELDEILANEGFDYIRPLETRDGSLYYIRRPKQGGQNRGMSPKDVVLAPWRVIKAIGGRLNFFTQVWAGESLTKKSGGPNPGKVSEKNEKDIFIGGNLIQVEKTLRENESKGEKHPGIAPLSWELCRISTSEGGFDPANAQVVRKGVLDYTFDPAGNLVFSNGKYIISRTPGGQEKALCKANVAVNIICCPEEPALES